MFSSRKQLVLCYAYSDAVRDFFLASQGNSLRVSVQARSLRVIKARCCALLVLGVYVRSPDTQLQTTVRSCDEKLDSDARRPVGRFDIATVDIL